MDGREKTMENVVRAQSKDPGSAEKIWQQHQVFEIRKEMGTKRMRSAMTHLELVHPFEQLARRREIDVLLQLERDDVGDGHCTSELGAVQAR